MSDFPPLPKMPKIPEEQKTQEVLLLLEIAKVKGNKPKPKIPPSKLREDAKKKRKQLKKKNS